MVSRAGDSILEEYSCREDALLASGSVRVTSKGSLICTVVRRFAGRHVGFARTTWT
jgi:hypothetical protein